ncbi:hypothetical protein HN587_01665 [Candidatus Woesearchaeota archaeon]|jgi:hypothetical protein|nr:hypothetical protein [Candidatus Woesearchaeota archaeon]
MNLKKEETQKPNSISMQKKQVYLVKKGCPICRGDLKGNDLVNYFCKSCNILFTRKDIRPWDIRKREIEEADSENCEKTETKKSKYSDLGKVIPTPINPEEINSEIDSEDNYVEETVEVKPAESQSEVDDSLAKPVEKIVDDPAEILEDANKSEQEESQELIQPDSTEDTDEIMDILTGKTTEEDGMQKPDAPIDAEFSEIEDTTTDEDFEETETAVIEQVTEEPKAIEQVTEEPEAIEQVIKEPEPEVIKPVTKKVIRSKKDEYSLEAKEKIIASKEANKIHSGTCHFVAKIQPENRLYFPTIKEGESKGYKLCVCLRRLKFIQRHNKKE